MFDFSYLRSEIEFIAFLWLDMIMKIFNFLFLFCFFYIFESFSSFKKTFELADPSGMNFTFISQKINYSDEIKVYNYIVSRKDLFTMKSLSVYGFNSEDDIISLLVLFYKNSKVQNLHRQHIGKMSVPLILSMERFFESFFDPSNVTMLPDSNVVTAFEYIIKKSDSDSICKVKLLKKSIKKDISLVEKLFTNIGELSIVVLDSKSSLSNGSIIIKEDSSSYHVYYIASDPYIPVAISNVKASVKSYIGMILDATCVNIEN